MQGTHNSQNNLKKEEQSCTLTLLNVKTYHKATDPGSVVLAQGEYICQWKGLGSPERNPYIYG